MSKPILLAALGVLGLLIATLLVWFFFQVLDAYNTLDAHNEYLEEELIDLRTEVDELSVAHHNLIKQVESKQVTSARSSASPSTSTFGGFSVDRDGSKVITPKRERGQPALEALYGTDNVNCIAALARLGSMGGTPEQRQQAYKDRDKHCDSE